MAPKNLLLASETAVDRKAHQLLGAYDVVGCGLHWRWPRYTCEIPLPSAVRIRSHSCRRSKKVVDVIDDDMPGFTGLPDPLSLFQSPCTRRLDS